MRVVGRYDRDQEAISRALADIQVKLGLLLDRADREQEAECYRRNRRLRDTNEE